MVTAAMAVLCSLLVYAVFYAHNLFMWKFRLKFSNFFFVVYLISVSGLAFQNMLLLHFIEYIFLNLKTTISTVVSGSGSSRQDRKHDLKYYHIHINIYIGKSWPFSWYYCKLHVIEATLNEFTALDYRNIECRGMSMHTKILIKHIYLWLVLHSTTCTQATDQLKSYVYVTDNIVIFNK